MIRAVFLTVALTGIGGFILGWLAFASREHAEHAAQQKTSHDLAEITHTFPLLPADVGCDRETPAIGIDGAGRIVLAWASQTDDLERTLWLTRSLDGGTTFETPVAFRKVPIHRQVRKMNGKERIFTTNVLPRLAVHHSVVHLAWVEAGRDGDRVEYLLASSQDGGKTFSSPRAVHGESATRPGYTALAVDDAGAIVCAWLDGRNKSQQPFASVSTNSGERVLTEKLVYQGGDSKGICPCCDLAAVHAANGSTYVAFRNADHGYRDIWVSRAKASSYFEDAQSVTTDHWRFEGCPHDGPSLAVSGGRLHVAWMDAHTGKRRVYFASSPMDHLAFVPEELSPGAPGEQAHPKVLADSHDRLHLVWDGSLQDDTPEPAAHEGKHQHDMRLQGSGRAIVYSRSPDGGNNFAPPRMIAPRAEVFQIQPSLAVSSAGVVCIVWNEMSTQGKSVVFARLSSYVPPCCVGK